MSTNGNMPPEDPMAEMPEDPQTMRPEPDMPEPTIATDEAEMADEIANRSFRAGARDDEFSDPDDIEGQSVAAAREERQRLMPEYLEHYFIEDLPPINPEDPWNQGIYMRYRINQWRYVNGMDPVE